MDTRGTSSVSPQAKAAASLTTTERSRQGKHGEGDSSKHHLDDIELAREDMGRRHSFKRILDEIDPMLSSKSLTTPPRAPPTSSAQSTPIQQQQQTNEALHSLLQATLQSSQNAHPNAQLQQALLSSLAGGTNLSQIAAQHQLQQQLQQQLLLNLAGSGSNLSTNLLSAALLGSTATGSTGPVNPTTSPQPTLSTNNLINSPTSSLGSPASSSRNNSMTPEQFAEDTMRKREVRLKKNREAARECRRKKKEYVRCLENRVAVLESQNQALIGELRALKELYLPKSEA